MMILSFNLLRLIQFLFSGILGIQMAQSNMVCLGLATIALAKIQTQSPMCVFATLILVLDALLGTAIFVAKNEKEIKSNLSFVSKIKDFTKSTKTS